VNGTPYYIAPEVLQGAYSKKVDCWSLGVIMYIILSGTPPFNGKNNQEILLSVYNGCFTFRPPTFKTVSDLAKDLISKLLVKDPNLRLSAAEAYQHPWIQGLTPLSQISLEVFQSIESFVRSQKLKQATLIYIANRLTVNDIESMRRSFRNMDKDGNGLLSREELALGMKRVGRQIDELTFLNLCSVLDTNKNGYVDYTEFLAACLYNRDFSNQGLLRTAFQYFDADNSGYITRDEIKKALTGGDVSIILPESEVNVIINEVDKNQDGQIDYSEFLEMMTHKL